MRRMANSKGTIAVIAAVLLALAGGSERASSATSSQSASVLSAGLNHSCAVTAAGAAVCWGDNTVGQLGNGTTSSSSVPTPVSGLSNGVAAIAVGNLNHSCAAKTDGTAWCWGENLEGELGNGTTSSSLVPVQVSGLSGVVSVSVGYRNSCALTNVGGVWCWGSGGPQLGNGTTDPIPNPIPVQVSGLSSGVVAISEAAASPCAVTSTGEAWCWGLNNWGRLRDGTNNPSSVPIRVESSGIVAITSNEHFSCVLTGAGELKCWGLNNLGQLGDGTTTESFVPVQVTGLSTGVVAISSGSAHSCAVTDAGAVLCWGYGAFGQLGNDTAASSLVPVQVSGLSSGVIATGFSDGYSSCAVMGTGAAKCWGENSSGQLGDGTTERRFVPVDVGGLEVKVPSSPPPPDVVKYVALGDSYSSGEGVDPYLRDGYDPISGTQPGDIDNRCHRSTRAYATWVKRPTDTQPLYALASGGGNPGSGKRVNKYGSDQNVRAANGVEWAYWACSGAETINVLPGGSGGQPQLDEQYREQFTQLDNPSVDSSTDLVTITVGGNDAGFADALFLCFVSACNTPSFQSNLEAAIDGLRISLPRVYEAIKARTGDATVLVLGYPQIFPPSERQSCGKLRPWRGEMDMFRALGLRLNQAIRDSAEGAGLTYLDPTNSFAGHEVCGAAGEWINGPSATYKKSKNFTDDESFHPNLTGQKAYAEVVNAALG